MEEKKQHFKPAFRSLKGSRLCMDCCCTCSPKGFFSTQVALGRWSSVSYVFFLVYVNFCFGPYVFNDTMAEKLALYFSVSRYQT